MDGPWPQGVELNLGFILQCERKKLKSHQVYCGRILLKGVANVLKFPDMCIGVLTLHTTKSGEEWHQICKTREKNLIFLKKGKTVISVENRKFSRSRMTKRRHQICKTREKNLIFLKKGKTVISVENRKFSRSRMTKRTAPLNLKSSEQEKFRQILR